MKIDRKILALFCFLIPTAVFGQRIGSQLIDDSKVSDWLPKQAEEYEYVYHFGDSEMESELLLLLVDGKWYAQIKLGGWGVSDEVSSPGADDLVWIWHFENLTNVKITGNKFYSEELIGEFVVYDNGRNKIKGLKIYDSRSGEGENEIGPQSYPVTDYFAGKYPQASLSKLTIGELRKMPKADLRIMRNEIFARYGYIFKDGGAMDIYFSKQDWYAAQHDRVYQFFTDLEKENIKVIQQVEMTRLQQSTDTLKTAKMDSLIKTNKFMQALKTLPFDSLQMKITFNTIHEILTKGESEVWVNVFWWKDKIDLANNLIRIRQDRYVIEFKGYEDSYNEIATIVVREWYHPNNKYLSIYQYSSNLMRFVETDQDFYKLDASYFLDPDFMRNSTHYTPKNNYGNARFYEISKDGLTVSFSYYIAAVYLGLNDIIYSDVIASYFFKWDRTTRGFSDFPINIIEKKTDAVRPAFFSVTNPTKTSYLIDKGVPLKGNWLKKFVKKPIPGATYYHAGWVHFRYDTDMKGYLLREDMGNKKSIYLVSTGETGTTQHYRLLLHREEKVGKFTYAEYKSILKGVNTETILRTNAAQDELEILSLYDNQGAPRPVAALPLLESESGKTSTKSEISKLLIELKMTDKWLNVGIEESGPDSLPQWVINPCAGYGWLEIHTEPDTTSYFHNKFDAAGLFPILSWGYLDYNAWEILSVTFSDYGNNVKLKVRDAFKVVFSDVEGAPEKITTFTYQLKPEAGLRVLFFETDSNFALKHQASAIPKSTKDCPDEYPM